VYKNGASLASAVLTLERGSHCLSRAAFEAQVSLAACGDAASCEARDGAGRVVTSCEELETLALEKGVQPEGSIRVYGVERDKRFIFASEYVGFARYLPQLKVTLVTLSLEPRLFGVEGFLTEQLADEVIKDALAIDDDEHRFMLSSTGPKGYSPSSSRTSENAWLKFGPAATKLKRSAFTLLGMDFYDEEMADGLQVLRYDIAKAYVAHTDYLSRPADLTAEQMDPKKGGSNRLATLFLYLSDVDEGGQTVFPLIDRPKIEDVKVKEYLETKNTDDIDWRNLSIEKNSWEDKMIYDCYSKLAVRPKKGRAILYYSQKPSGELDPLSKHGGCPVLSGTKWAANLWIWNKKMPFGSSRFPANADNNAKNNAIPISIDYQGHRTDIGLYWQGTTKIGDNLRPKEAMRLSSYLGHSFVAKNEHGRIFASFTIEQGKTIYLIDDDA